MAGSASPPVRVLSTLNADGTRNRIRPKLFTGKLYRRRLVTAWLLIALFVGLPFLRVNGKPAVLLDIPHRQFHLFGNTFLPTDGVLLMVLMLGILLGIVLITAVVGRAWCGWGCPQTVYMEFVFRPIERLIEGGRNGQLRLDQRGGWPLRRVVKNVIFAVLSILVANVFLSYFVGVEALARWMRQSPAEHPTPFLVMAATAGLVFFDFAYFREQMCTVACPYARLQSVLLDKKSVIIGYDERRGEPRSFGKPRPGSGDCIDCKACVVACPTGIDIREGLQMECIACGQCVDACNTIMPRVNKPLDLIRYGSQLELETGTRQRLLRPRVIVYALLLVGLIAALFVLGSSRGSAEVTLLRGIGAPYVLDQGTVRNQIRIKIVNRTDQSQAYHIELVDAADLRLIAPENPLRIEAGQSASTSVFVVGDAERIVGERPIAFRVRDESRFDEEVGYKLVGPQLGGDSSRRPTESQKETEVP